MLSDFEQRRLREIERCLEADDPEFVGSFATAGRRRKPSRSAVVAVVAGLIAVSAGMAGLPGPGTAAGIVAVAAIVVRCLARP